MQNLLQFLFKNGAFFIFLILESFCIFLIVKTNQHQRSIFLNSSQIFSNKLNQKFDAFLDYWQLNQFADSLALENARLKTALYNNRRSSIPTSPGDSTGYEIIVAKVINNSVVQSNNYITIDKGSAHGLQKGMGVTSADGLVGIITDCSKQYSRVISLLNRDTKISASIRRNNYFGTLSWHGFNPRMMRLGAIPKHADLQVGDTVQTSGYSSIFPPEIMVGRIDTFWLDRGSNFHTIKVQLKNDLSKLDYVTVIRNTARAEQQSLENSADNE